LLPLNIPEDEPLIYCPEGNLIQSQIKLENIIYECENEKIKSTCLETDEDILKVATESSSTTQIPLTCEQKAFDVANLHYYSTGILSSSFPIVCNATESANNVKTTLNCYFGELPPYLASFIPTTESSMSQTTTPKNDVGFFTKTENFFRNLFGMSKDEEKFVEETTEFNYKNGIDWVPEALPVDLG
jgi:hypothetical protein